MKVSATKIEDKVEIFVEIFGKNTYDLNLIACRIKFKEFADENMFKQDEIGSGLFTLTLDQAKSLNAELTEILSRPVGCSSLE